MSRKINSFTVFELVIGMLLSAIVIGMIYRGYEIMMKVYDSHLIASRRQSELIVMETTLQKDFDKAITVRANGQKIDLLDSLGSQSLSYLIIEDKLIRNSALADTFKLDHLNISLGFESAPIKNGLIDELMIAFKFGEISQKITIAKKYSAQQLFNQNQ